VKLARATVLLTGATGGIGHAIARRLHGEGARLILTGRRTDVLEPLAQELGARSIAADLSDREAPARLLEEAGDVDVLVANAALPASGLLDSFGVDEIDRALDVNLRAPIVLARLLAPKLAARGSGHLVFISSLAGRAAAPRSSLYSGTKYGLRGFALGLRADLHAHGVGVSTVFPGFIRDAGMFAESGAKLPRGVGTSTPEQVAKGVQRAIERNKAEVVVAPAGVRMGAFFGGVAPSFAERATRRLGGDKVAAATAAGQAEKR
jgi:short-subunit dehydrogenase